MNQIEYPEAGSGNILGPGREAADFSEDGSLWENCT